MPEQTELVKTSETNELSVPTFINRGSQAKGMETLSKYVTPPYLKLIQKQTQDEQLNKHGRGSTTLSPSDVMVAKLGEPFYFTPIFFYTEYCTWADYSLQGNEDIPTVLERTVDPESDLAKKCMDFDRHEELNYVYTNSDGKEFVLGVTDGKNGFDKPVRHVEHLTFIVVVHTETGNTPCVMSFQRGTFKSGKKFINLLAMRQSDIFGCVFEGRVPEQPMSNKSGDTWHYWDVSNPSEISGKSPWVSEAEYAEYAKLNLQFEQTHQQGLLRADREADEVVKADAAVVNDEL